MKGIILSTEPDICYLIYFYFIYTYLYMCIAQNEPSNTANEDEFDVDCLENLKEDADRLWEG